MPVAPIARHVLESSVEPMQLQGHGTQVGCSIGIAMVPPDARTLADLIKKAAAAMYAAAKRGAKAAGANAWRFLGPTMVAPRERRRR